MSDEIKNWYKETKSSGFKKGKDFKNHEIEPASMIGLIGQSGAGKSTALIEFISRAPKLTEIHLFSGSGSANTMVAILAAPERYQQDLATVNYEIGANIPLFGLRYIHIFMS